ncbi:MAG TPA: ankyrin repeat domain-containing protein [Vicinamibacterales bacterium]|nr:ankyrin repeat domain-containing protein [Vicinamibacterales bacterium]
MAQRTSLMVVCLGLAAAWAFAAGVQARAADTPVADAARAGDREAVRTLLQQGGDVDAAHGDGMTPLHWAAMRGDEEIARMLVHAGANLKAVTRLGRYTPLALAAEQGHSGVVAQLVRAGADVNAADSMGTTVLMLMAASGDADPVRLLIAHGADVHAREQAMKQTALMFAAAYNRAEAIAALVGHGADVKTTSRVVDLAALSNPAAGRGRSQGVQGGAAAAPQVAGLNRPFLYNELVGTQGGLTPLLFAVRQGHVEATEALLRAGADVNHVGAGDKTSPLLMAIINGHFDLAQLFIDDGADVSLASEGGVTPLYAVLNVQWAPNSMYPQPQAHRQQRLSYLDLMRLLLDNGADVNARLKKKVWYSSFNTDLSGVDEIGATPFWRAAYASDVEAMRLLVAYGADRSIPTIRPAARTRSGDSDRDPGPDVSGRPPVPVGGPGVPPLLAAAGVGYGEGFAANSHRYAPSGFLAAITYLVDELGADVNAVDHEGNTAIHHAAARGDTESILYLVAKGADVTKVNREGRTTADMANGPVQRVQPFPETLAVLMKLGARNNNTCVSC